MPTQIAWTEETWNPITGCSKISAGCKNCYAEEIALLQKARGIDKYRKGFEVTLHENSLRVPFSWKTPRLVFVCSMSDLFHEKVPFDFIDRVLSVIKSSEHTYQLLTKRADRMAEYFTERDIPQNAWLGVSVDVADSKTRIDYLRNLNAPIRFLSCEPLLGDLGELNLENIDWVIVGGESVPKARQKARGMKMEWILSIKAQADKQNTLFYFKQWGTMGCDGIARSTELNGKQLNGKIYQAMPNVDRHTLFG